MKKISATLCTFLFSGFLFADNAKNLTDKDCPNISLDTKENSYFKKLPIYDQDGLGTCFSYAGSELLNYKFKTKMDPNFLAINHFTFSDLMFKRKMKAISPEKGENLLNERGGSAAATFTSFDVTGRNFCTEEEMSSILNNLLFDDLFKNADLSKLSSYNEAKLLNTVASMLTTKKHGKEFFTRKGNESEEDFNKRIDARIKEDFSSIFYLFDSISRPSSCKLDIKNILKNPGPEKFLNKIQNFEDITQYLKQEITSKCKNRVEEFTYTYSRGKDLINEAIEVLGEESPVAISFCSKILKNENNGSFADKIEIKSDGQKADRTFIEKGDNSCGAHEAIVVRSKFSNGKCKFMIRNSWGTSCNQYGKNWEVERDIKDPNSCVGVWIDSDTLDKNLTDITYIN